MKLLITTQSVDTQDPTLGFFHRWIEEFAKHVESIEVICLYEGVHDLPANVTVHSLGKEKAQKSHKRTGSLMYAFRFIRLAWKLRNAYDEVFVHMNPEYAVLGGIGWKLWKKRVGLWYVHKSVDMKLRIAAVFSYVIFTASKESFRLETKKVRVVGHGIDTDVFACEVSSTDSTSSESSQSNVDLKMPSLRIVTVGRISNSKNLHILIDAVRVLGERGVKVSFDIIGAPVTLRDIKVEDDLKKQVAHLPEGVTPRFMGVKTQTEVAKLLCDYDFFIHASTGTGSIDKAVLEALAARVPVVSTSEAFRDLLQPYGLFVSDGSPEGIAAAVLSFTALPAGEKSAIRTALRNSIVKDYSLGVLIPRILLLLAGTVE